MAVPRDNLDQLDALLGSLLDRTATDATWSQLGTLLQDNPAAQDEYLAFLAVHTELVWKHESAPQLQVPAEDTSLEEDKRRDEFTSTLTPRSKSLLDWASRNPKGPAIAIAVTVLIAALVVMGLVPVKEWTAGRGKNDAEGQPPEDPAASEFVAILNNAHQAKWLDGTRPRLKDPRLRVGRRLAIASGLIEVKYYTGARVVIEGPAEFTVGGMKEEGGRMKEKGSESEGHPSSFIPHPSNSGYLSVGNLVASVEGEKAQGFTIRTPSARVEDLGTEFGVAVNDHGAANVVVLGGEIDVVSKEEGSDREKRTRLVRGEAASIAADGADVTRHSGDNVDTRFAASMRRRLRWARGVKFQQIALRNATADISQTEGENRPVAETIDGVIQSNNGWALGGGPQFDDHVAVWETAEDIQGPCILRFDIHQRKGSALRKIRLSVTGDSREVFADGLPADGAVDANWVVLKPDSAMSNQAVAVQVDGDSRISFGSQASAGGAAPVYTIVVECPLDRATGVRLEVFADPSVGYGKPNPSAQLPGGNGVVTEFQAKQGVLR